MIRKAFYILTATAAILLVSCKKYDNAIADIKDRLDKIEGTSLTTIDQQITAINGSIDDLKGVDGALQSLIDNLEDNAADLQAKNTELDQKIADLQAYVDNELSTTKDWANATFATLTQYDAVQTEISAIKALIEQNKTDITAAYTDAIKTAITASETSMKEWVNGVLADGYYTKAEIDGKITALQTQVTEGDAALQKEIDDLAAALAQAESDLTAAYKKAIEDAITDNNGKISAEIAAAVKTAQDNLQAQIDAINSEIEKIKARLDVIEADINSINQQITAINGSIDDLKGVAAELKGYIESLQTTAADLQSQIDATNTEIENVKKEMGDEIDAVEQSLLNKLDNLKATLEGELATIKANIETLKAKDTELEGKIAALETYVNNQLQATEDWVNATFATLAQYEEIQGTIAGIKGDIAAINTAIANLETRINEKIATDIKAAIDALRTELGADYAAKIEAATDAVTSAYTAAIATAKGDIEAAYTKAIADAIAASEAAMKEWVNGELQKVYSDISALRIELEALVASAATDEELAAAVAAQQTALEQAKSELTAAYEAAIKKAIEDNGGIINDAIAAAIAAATNNLQSEIDGIKAEITSIKSRIDTLEEKFATRIQSLAFVPQYTDGKILLDYTYRTTQAHFRISPASIAKLISAENVTAFARYTYDPTTRAFVPEFPLSVMSVTSDDSGVIEVNLKEDSNNLFDTEFWTGTKEAVIYICISDGNSNVVSDAVPMIAHGYGSNEGNVIRGFGDGSSSAGEVTE